MLGEFMMCEYWLVVVLSLSFVLLFYNIKLSKKIKARENGDELLIKNAYFNKFTNLPNRSNIDIVIHEQIERSKRHNKAFMVAVIEMLDYDEDKIVTLSNLIVDSLRDEDVVAHIENNLFLVLFNEYLEDENLPLLLQRLQRTLHKSKEYHVAIGKAHYPEDAEDVNSLIEMAKKDIKK